MTSIGENPSDATEAEPPASGWRALLNRRRKRKEGSGPWWKPSVAALIALLIGRRWAPVGGLAAGTIFFSAFITMLPGTLVWWLWPLAAVATAIGGWLALRIGGAKAALDTGAKKEDVFPDE